MAWTLGVDDGVEARRGRWRGGTAWTMAWRHGVEDGVEARRGRWCGGSAWKMVWRLGVNDGVESWPGGSWSAVVDSANTGTKDSDKLQGVPKKMSHSEMTL